MFQEICLLRVGVKSENHSASIILLKKLFEEEDLYKIISSAKEERIDKQYYVQSKQAEKITKDSCQELILKTENFLIKLKILMNKIISGEISSIRKSFEELFD